MIGLLRGKIVKKQPPILLLDVNGVGYEIEASLKAFQELPDTGSEISLFIHMIVRDDAHLLFGFVTERERALFRLVIRVNGIGAKLALAILSSMMVDEFVQCIEQNDVKRLVSLPGIGKKTAERLIIEMRDRFSEEGMASGNVGYFSEDDNRSQAIAAMVQLGYKRQEAHQYVASVKDASLKVEDIIRHALKHATNVTS